MSDHHSETTDDLSALAWVQDELRRSLEAAHKALRRFLKEAEAVSGSDVDAVDPSVLRTAHQQIHQGVGALELVGLPAVASVLRASEAAVKRFALKPQKMTSADVDVIEQTSFALLDYLQRLLAGKPMSALALFPRYRDVQTVAGADRVHPADLWSHDWRWRDVPAEQGVSPRPADASARTEMEQQMLLLMRGHNLAAAARMSDLCAGLGAGASDLAAATLWKLAGAFFQSQALGLLNADVFSKRVASRLLAQLRIFERGETEVSERLAQDLLFFCAQSQLPTDGRPAPRLAAAREAYDLLSHTPVDYEVNRLGRFDPAWIAQAKKRVSSAKDAWSGVAGGEMHRLGGLSEQFSLVGDSLRRLYAAGETLADELQAAVVQTQQSNAAPHTGLAMEVATSVLYLESSLEDTDFDHPDQAARVRRLAQRIANVRAGQTPDPLEAWMEELYRRVSDRQTMGSVVQELRASLGEVEKQIDTFFRKPAEPEALQPVPGQLQSMRGVMSVLGMDQASHALVRMREDVEQLMHPGGEQDAAAQAANFDRVAGNLGALGFLIDMLGAQPQVAKSLFVFDASSGTLSPLMGRSAAARNATNLAVPKSPVIETRVIEQAQALSEAAVSERMPLDALSSDLERLQHEAQVADQPGLVATIEQAQQQIEQAQGVQEVHEAREQLSEALADFVSTAGDAVGLDPLPQPTHAVAAPVAPPVVTGNDLSDDPEMREIFLEEAREKVIEARASLKHLQTASSDLNELTSLRRAFHTFKGSSRMVGLKEFGDAAWSCEQLYNTWLAGQDAATPALLDFSDKALTHLSDWIEAIAEQKAAGYRAEPLVKAAEAFGRGEPVTEIVSPSAESADLALMSLSFAPETPAAVAAAESTATAEPVAELPALPELGDAPSDAPLNVALLDEAIPTAEVTPSTAGDLPEVSFDLDLGSFDDAPTAFAPVAETPALPLVADDLALDDGLDAPALPETPAFDADDALPVAESVELIELDLDDSAFTADTPAAQIDLPDVPTVIEPRAEEPLQERTVIEPRQADVPLPELTEGEPEPEPELEPELPVAEIADTIEAAELPEAIEVPEVAEAVELQADPDAGEVAESAPYTDDDQVRVVGPLRISIPLFNIYLNEADELSRKLTTEVAEWAMELHRPVGEVPIALAHSLAGSSATVGFTDLSQLSRTLEHALMRSQAIGQGVPEEGRLFVDTAEEIRRLLHQFAAGFLKSPPPELLARLADHELTSARRLEEVNAVDTAVVDEPLDIIDIAPEAPVADLPPPSPDAPVQDTRPGALDALPADSGLADLKSTDFSPLAGELGQSEYKAFTPLATLPTAAPSTPFRADLAGDDGDEDIDAIDAVDAELFPIFEEEAEELLPQLDGALRDWVRKPADRSHAASCMRTLHTLKGGARLAGAMRLGEMAHRLETAIEHLLANDHVESGEVERLQSRSDALTATFEALKSRDAKAYAEAAEALEDVAPVNISHAPDEEEPVLMHTSPSPLDEAPALPVIQPSAALTLVPPSLPSVDLPQAADESVVDDTPLEDLIEQPAAAVNVPTVATEIDWSRFADRTHDADTAGHQPVAAANASVRVRGPLLERMVNQAGEVSITRSRIEAEVGNIRGSLNDLTDNLERLRQQLRDIEFQAETQMISRQEAAKAAHETFDPLESDRFTRFQELTRMMAESVNDVATVQRTLQRTLETTEDELAAQARLTRDLQDDLLRTRMVEFESQSDRLYRVVRQAAKETGKQVRLDILGGSIEIDRGVLDRMTPAFEHLLRNCVTHGIEQPDVRAAAGKDNAGNIVVVLRQEGNEVAVEFRDDGAGLNLERIRKQGEKMGLITAGSEHTDGELANMIFMPGFSTAETVTELSGRGVGMDVVRSEVNAMGGRIETATAPGQGTSFTLVLPLTTAVTQVVMIRCGTTVVAVPAVLIEIVRRVPAAELEAAYESGSYTLGERSMLFFWFGALLQQGSVTQETGRTRPVIVVRSAQQRVALHVDEVLGTQEVVVKNLGPQLSRLPGLAGMTLLASGAVALIYNPVALATLYGDTARQATTAARHSPTPAKVVSLSQHNPVNLAPLILVVDDSLTVRRVTQRLLVREGFRVVLAKDGIEALERLADDLPQVVLSDIEMPRMDGFDLARNIRADARLSGLPIIMITSRIAQKHRDYAAELGVDHYLGKPYSEEDLLALIGRYTGSAALPA